MKILGVGCEIVEVLRIAQMIERHGELFLTRVFTPYEIEYCASRKHANQQYSAHWAAKEALLKAFGTGWQRGIRFKDFELRIDDGVRVKVALAGIAREICEQQRVTDIQLSFSHCRTHAMAHVVVVGKEEVEEES